jgi:hypothetical protein
MKPEQSILFRSQKRQFNFSNFDWRDKPMRENFGVLWTDEIEIAEIEELETKAAPSGAWEPCD